MGKPRGSDIEEPKVNQRLLVVTLVTLIFLVAVVYLSPDDGNQPTSGRQVSNTSVSVPIFGKSDQAKPAAEYVDVKLKKKRFFEYLLPMITITNCLLYTSPSPRDATLSRMPSSA